jgi:hypothetical protein
MRIPTRLPLAAALAAALLGVVSLASSARADDEPKTDDATRGYVGYGADFIQGLKSDQKKEYGIAKEKGLYVNGVTPGSPAAVAGLKVGDVLVSINGKAIPDTSAVDPKEEKSTKAWFEGEWKTITHAVKPGDEVAVEIERKGDKQTIRAKAVTKDVLEELRKEAEEEEQAVKVPDPAKAGTSNAAGFSFEGLAEGVTLPNDFLGVTGYWSVEEEEDKPSNHAVRQLTDVEADRELAVVTGDGRALADGKVTVRLAPLKGMKAVGGGIAMRVKDRLHYYAAVVNGVERSLRIVRVEKKDAKTLATVEIPSPKLRSWHTLEVTMAGPKLTAVLDGSAKVEATDSTYAHGWAGLLTESDAVTLFDDLKIAPK